MEEPTNDNDNADPKSGYRLVRIVVLETLLIAIVGFAIWGVAWDMGFPNAGLIIAIVVWLTVSPVIEIATVLNYRKAKGPSQESIRKLAIDLRARCARIDVLVNNAGTVHARRTLTAERIESTFAVNHLGYFLRKRIMSSGPRNSSPPAPDTATLVPLLYAPKVLPDTVPSTIMIGMATKIRKAVVSLLSGRSG